MLTTTDTAVGKALVRHPVDEVMNTGDLDRLDELYTPAMARAARRWIEPFSQAFPDCHMQIVQLVAEDDTVVGRFRCSGTHLGTWRGHEPTGRRFENIDEVCFSRIQNGRIA
jgi:predicted ester cyclase